MKSRFLALAVLGPISLLSLALAADKPVEPKPAADGQDVVFLGETRPLLVRLHVQVDGKSIQAGREAFLKSLFKYLDVNGDGVLDKAEAERVLPLDLIFSGALNRGAFGGKGQTSLLEALDTNKDGKVTLAELDAYYGKNGLVPFKVQVAGPPSNQMREVAIFTGKRPDPSGTAVGAAVFGHLDTNRDGKLTREELTAAPTVLLRLDDNEDDLLTPAELVPEELAPAGQSAKMAAMMAAPGAAGQSAGGNKILVALPAPGVASHDLVRLIQERYGPKKDKPEEKKLTCKDLGLDEATFAQLDVNRDGVLDSAELVGFVKRLPDLQLNVRVAQSKSKAGFEVVPRSPLADRCRATEGGVHLDLGLTRVDLRTTEESLPFFFTTIVRQQFLALFTAADKDNNGYLDEKEAGNNQFFKNLFKAMDRDGDGKVYQKEMTAFLDKYLEFQKQANSACVTLVLSDQHKGLFDLLDENRDGRLSVREMRQAAKLLEQFDRQGKGHLTRTDLPRSYQLTLRRGPVDSPNNDQAKAFAAIYGGGYSSEPSHDSSAGPLWFRKMDRNRDGDVSRKEFLGSDEEFRKIDTDGDGLISLEEAKRADAQLRKAP